MANALGTRAGRKRQPAPMQSVIVAPGLIGRTLWLLRRSFVAAFDDNCFSIAKGAAYSFLLSIFPVLTALTSILVTVQAQSVVNVIQRFMAQVAPPGTERLILGRLQTGSKPIALPIVAFVVALWAGSGAMISLMEGFQAAYRLPSGRPFLKERAMAIFLVIVAAVPAVMASSLILFGNRGEAAFIHWIGVSRDLNEFSAPLRVLWRVVQYLVAFCATTFVTGLLYYFGANHRPVAGGHRGKRWSRFAHVWPGAFVATVLWLAATAAFAWYVGHRISSYNVFYGSIGAVIVLIIWLYLIACIALIGCEFNAERERAAALRTR
ncbi:MAG: YihY/virulence factor BrkB family protein [Bryobacteraceae bacterium]